MISGPQFGVARFDKERRKKPQLKQGTFRRILPYATRFRWAMVLLLFITALDACITAGNPILLGLIIDKGVLRHSVHVVVELSLAVAGLAVIDAVASYTQTWYSARIGEGVVCELRTSLFRHLQRQPLAFFTRTQTGSLVSRLNNDINGAQRAVTLLLSNAVSTLLTAIIVLSAMFYLSWQISLVALLAFPLFFVPGRLIGKRLQRFTLQGMQMQAEMGTMTTERFNVAGALLAKLYGRLEEEDEEFANRASRMRDVAVALAVNGQLLSIVLTLIAALITALVYGAGGSLIIHGAFQIGTLVALAALISRVYGPLSMLSNMQLNVLTAMVSFERVFEILDLQPLIVEQPGAYALSATGTAPEIEFDNVSFRYPAASEISLPSLESILLPAPERTGDAWVLRDVSFRAPAGRLTALVGPSGGGKTTITHLVPRLYDPTSGTVRIGGHDVKDLTLRSLRDLIGVVPQDAHLFHDTIRANLAYARPGATEAEMIEACKAARIWDLISSLPNGLDTVAGDRGYRLSGGEKQRVALARLLLKAPPVVVLDEATAHLDSESEVAVQRALKAALSNRTSLVIAHRLSTIREANQILVIDEGRVVERGTHEELLAASGLYAELYRTQFASQEKVADQSAALPITSPSA